MQIKNLFESAYYRRLILAYIIDEQGPISTVEIVGLLNWPRNTVKTILTVYGIWGLRLSTLVLVKLAGINSIPGGQ